MNFNVSINLIFSIFQNEKDIFNKTKKTNKVVVIEKNKLLWFVTEFVDIVPCQKEKAKSRIKQHLHGSGVFHLPENVSFSLIAKSFKLLVPRVEHCVKTSLHSYTHLGKKEEFFSFPQEIGPMYGSLKRMSNTMATEIF